MTLEEALIEVYESTDEQSDLNIYEGDSVSLGARGSKRIIEFLRRAQNAVSVWKFPGGRRLRFRVGTKTVIVKVEPIVLEELTRQSDTTLLATGVKAPARLPDASSLFIGEQAFPIVSWVDSGTSDSIITLAGAHGVTEASGVYSTQYVTLAFDDFIGVVSVYDIDERFALERGSDYDQLTDGLFSLSSPTEYAPLANGFLLGSCPPAAKNYIVRYQRYPRFPQALSESFELPLSTHEAICEYAKYTANLRIGKSEAAQIAWAKAQTLLASVRLEADLEEDFIERETEVTKWR